MALRNVVELCFEATVSYSLCVCVAFLVTVDLIFELVVPAVWAAFGCQRLQDIKKKRKQVL